MNTSDLLKSFNAKLNENAWWARFVNSQFIQMMTVLGAQVIYLSQTYASRALTEGFISTATRRASILAAAEDRGYVGRLVESSTGTVSIKNKGEEEIALPAGAELLSADLTPLALAGSVVIPPGKTVEAAGVRQHEAVSITFDIDVEQPFLTLLLDRDLTAEVSELSVTVITDGKEQLWQNNPLFRMARADSCHYAMVYKPTEQLGVRFGDGLMGMMPPARSQVRIDVMASKGDYTLAQGQKLEAAGNIARYAQLLDIVSDTIISGGGGMEPTDETRNRAQYYVPFDEQVIWGGDYRHFIQGKISKISWLNVWGEAVQERITGFDVRNINRIFFCGHKPGVSQEQLKSEIMEVLEAVPNELNKHFEYVPTNDKPFLIILSGIIKKSVLVDDVRLKLKATLEEHFGPDSTSFNDAFQSDESSQQYYAQVKEKDIWRVVEALDVFTSYHIDLIGMEDAVNMNDFVYLDVPASDFSAIDYP